ncbi:hypothetical protein [Raoultella ornithinolytica]|uniref:hypothetical protein n=1 Tax=Raoultella ornithinolytica TaxID=54291 RepID=UPI0021AFA76E|nr:hypothetical protein [Raoultella ornithinolytica]MCT4737225.1 hypothetical protein [Raoultella ornithinolytica]
MWWHPGPWESVLLLLAGLFVLLAVQQATGPRAGPDWLAPGSLLLAGGMLLWSLPGSLPGEKAYTGCSREVRARTTPVSSARDCLSGHRKAVDISTTEGGRPWSGQPVEDQKK